MAGMTLLDRILGREPSVANPATPPKPHNFCSHCGEPMVDGYMVIGREFDRETGQPVKRVERRRMCVTLHGKERPTPIYEDDELVPSPMSHHDGFSAPWSPFAWEWRPTETVPDCDPRKDGAA